MGERKELAMAGKMMDEEFGIEMSVGIGAAADMLPQNAPWPAAPHELRRLRIRKRESQEKFWSRFGVTQSSGSRFETGVMIPPPVAILLRLYVNGTVKDEDLHG
jgi:hypothetical protein